MPKVLIIIFKKIKNEANLKNVIMKMRLNEIPKQIETLGSKEVFIVDNVSLHVLSVNGAPFGFPVLPLIKQLITLITISTIMMMMMIKEEKEYLV